MKYDSEEVFSDRSEVQDILDGEHPGVDPDTGLPALPAGYYFKVKVYWGEYNDVPSVRVAIRKRVGRIFYSTQVEDRFALGSLDPRDVEEGREWALRRYPLVAEDPDTYPQGIKDAAETLLEKWSKTHAKDVFYARFEEAAERLSGNYPPKSI